MMDAVVQYELAAAREVVRERRGTVLGFIQQQSLTGKQVARNKHGKVAGVYDPSSGETRDARGQFVARGNLLPALLFTRP